MKADYKYISNPVDICEFINKHPSYKIISITWKGFTYTVFYKY